MQTMGTLHNLLDAFTFQTAKSNIQRTTPQRGSLGAH